MFPVVKARRQFVSGGDDGRGRTARTVSTNYYHFYDTGLVTPLTVRYQGQLPGTTSELIVKR